MRRRIYSQPEVPWWLRPANPHASSAPPLPPEAIRHLQEEEKRRETVHKRYVLPAPIEENVANNDDAPILPPPAPAAPAPPLMEGEAPTVVPLPPPEPPPLDAIAEFIRKYLVCSDHQLTVLVLWIVHTYCYDYFPATPYLNIFSPERQSGKSICLQLLSLLCCRPWMPGGVTRSRIMKSVAGSQPALLLDDWHTFFHPSSSSSAEAQPIIGFLNAGSNGGYRNSTRLQDSRSWNHNGDEAEVLPISTPRIYCPKAFAGPGDLPVSLADRCVPVALKRKKNNEPAEPFWPDIAEPVAADLVKSLPAWVKHNWKPLRVAACDLLYASSGFSLRRHTFVVPLLTVAEVVGGKWPRKARAALRKIFNAAPVEPPTVGLQLLSDIRDFFIREHDPLRIHTGPLLEYLNHLEDRPWRTSTKELTPNRLRDILRYFSIDTTGAQDIGGKNLRGFTFHHFSDSWRRYLPHLPPRRPGTGHAAADLEINSPGMHDLGSDGVRQNASSVNTELNTVDSNNRGENQAGPGLQVVSNESQPVTNGVQGVRKPSQGVRNSPQAVRNSQPVTINPTVFNDSHRGPAPANPIQPKQISGDHECSTARAAIPDP